MTHDGLLTISEGFSRKARSWPERQYLLSQLVERMQDPIKTNETVEQYKAMPKAVRAAVKDVGGFVGGRVAGQRKAANVGDRCLLALDADHVEDDIWTLFKQRIDAAAILHTTHSHTREDPRLRLLIPLKVPISPAQYEPIARRIAERIGIDNFDDTTYQHGRLMYWPSVPKDADWLFQTHDAPWLDPEEILGTYANWQDVAQWPRSSRQKQIPRRHAERAQDPTIKDGWVGSFCRSYTIAEAIEKFLPEIYKREDDDRWTFQGGSSFGGMIVYDDKYAYSYHDTDPAKERLCNAFDLVRIHKFGSLDRHPELPVQQLPSYKAMIDQLCAQDDKTREDWQERRRAERMLEFSAEAPQSDTAALYNDDALDYTCLPQPEDKSDMAFSKAFRDWARGVIMHNKALDWMYYDGIKWRTGQASACTRLLLTFIDALAAEAKAEYEEHPEDADTKARMQWTQQAKGAGRIGGIMKLTEGWLSEDDVDKFDARATLLNTPGGVWDLTTGSCVANDPGFLMTMTTKYAPDLKGRHPMWDDLLWKACGGDQELIDYLQLAAGMALFGDVYEEGMLMSVGPGSNGKSTIFGTWLDALGNYALTIRQELMMESRSEVVGLAEIRGKRLVVIGETEDGANIKASMLKRLTSRDEISAKRLYLDPFSFRPSHTLVMHTNFLPKLKSLDGGTRRRIAVVPLEHKFEGAEVITDYDKRMQAAEGPQILGWMIKGAMKFWQQSRKLTKPAVVSKATGDYFAEEDWLARFLTERCTVDSQLPDAGCVPAQALFDEYRAWAIDENLRYTVTRTAFKKALEARGFRQKTTSKSTIWQRIALSALPMT